MLGPLFALYLAPGNPWGKGLLVCSPFLSLFRVLLPTVLDVCSSLSSNYVLWKEHHV